MYILKLVLLGICILAQTAFAEKRALTVMIDPGHGGDDIGAQFGKAVEKDIALQVGLKLRDALKTNSHFKAILTRDTDVFVPLDQRKTMANERLPDIFISIHANSSPDAKARGTEFYFENQVPTDEESLMVADRENNIKESSGEKTPTDQSDLTSILTDLAHQEHIVMSEALSDSLFKSFKVSIGARAKAIRQAPFRVLLIEAPSSLVELGYVSNAEEGQWLTKSETHRSLAQDIYRGILAFKEKLDKSRDPPVK